MALHTLILYVTYLACLLFCAITAFICRKHLKSRLLLLFVPYLFALTCQEVIAFIYVLQKKQTSHIYNTYMAITTLFFVFFYYRIPCNKPTRKVITLMTVVYLAALITTFCFQSILSYNRYLTLAGEFVMTSCAVFFLVNYFTLDNHQEERKWAPIIWISTGIIIFYPVTYISFTLYNYLIPPGGASSAGFKLYQVIPQLMSIIMYSLFAHAFILCRKKI